MDMCASGTCAHFSRNVCVVAGMGTSLKDILAVLSIVIAAGRAEAAFAAERGKP